MAGGEVAFGVLEEKEEEFLEKKVKCRLSRVNAVLGTHLGVHEVETLFKQLDFRYHWDGRDQFTVTVPTYRVDIHEEIDLIEEVARIYGYDNIDKKIPAYHPSKIGDTPMYSFEGRVRERLIAEGLQEFITCDLIGPSQVEMLKDSMMSSDSTLHVVNPISIEQSILRTSLIPGLLHLVKGNLLYQNHDIAGFEIGRIHFKEGKQVKEQTMAGIILTGKKDNYHFDSKPHEVDFYDLKGVIENLFAGLNIGASEFRAQQLSAFHPGKTSRHLHR